MTARHGLTCCTAIAAALLAAPGLQADEVRTPEVPVIVGGEGDLDACGGTGVVTGFTGTLNLRAGPGTGYPVLARLAPETGVIVCAEEQGWTGILVAEEGRACGTGTPITPAQPYAGPCRSGWIASRFFRLRAG